MEDDRDDELEKLGSKTEVWLRDGVPLETPVAQVQTGVLFAFADERDPQVGALTVPATPGAETPLAGMLTPEAPGVDRRDVLRLMGLGALASTACIRRPEESIVSYIQRPDDQVAAVPTHYASVCGGCAAGCGILVKTREGRPVKIEGLDAHPINEGKLCRFGQAGLQGLYHPERLRSPRVRVGTRLDDTTWDDLFERLAATCAPGRRVAILTGPATGHAHVFYQEVLKRLGADDELYVWDSNGLVAAAATAHRLAFGTATMPRIDFSRVRLTVGVGSDFLDFGLSPVAQQLGFSRSHSYELGQRGELIQFESNLSLTGAQADQRLVIAPGSEGLVLMILVQLLLDHPAARGSAAARAHIAAAVQASEVVAARDCVRAGVDLAVLRQVADKLLQTPSVILAGGSSTQDHRATQTQLAAILANVLIGAYDDGALKLHHGWLENPLGGKSLRALLAAASEIDVLIAIDVNPLFTAPAALGVREKLAAIPTVVSMQSFPNEMDELASLIVPIHHYLEAWGDAQPVAGLWSLRQPVVRPTTGSRQAEDVLLWALAYGKRPLPYPDMRAFLWAKWRRIFEVIAPSSGYERFMQEVAKHGFVGRLSRRPMFDLGPVGPLLTALTQVSEGLTLTVPLDLRVHDGRFSHLPVLQEMGDPLTTVTWDSWLALHPATLKARGLRQGDVVRLTSVAGSLEVAVLAMPGLHPDLAVLPQGGGRRDPRSTISYGVGVQPFELLMPVLDTLSDQPITAGQRIELTPTGKRHRLAALQKHSDIGNRSDIIKFKSLPELRDHYGKTIDLDAVPDLYPKLDVDVPYRWGLAVDLDKCTGCGACTVACATENNVPQVGRDQVLMGRNMHWIRLDRYFKGDLDRPQTVFQPVMCQHCQHAPCEAVCPVYATSHDSEGMNAMTYNRCVGTRYCANACPYKVRRFNWWTHKWGVMGERPVDRNPRAVNPDVTVRTRGVMEKCSFCVGRIRAAKHEAKKEDRLVRDGEVVSACQQTCPAEAITFGNLKDPESRIAKLRRDPRSYLLLGGDPEHGHYGLKTLPGVHYMARVELDGAPETEHH